MTDPHDPTSSEGTPGSGPSDAPDTTGYSATAAIGYGWQKFKASPGTLLIPMIVVFVGLVVAALIIQFVVVGGWFGKESCETGNINGQKTLDCGQSFWRQLLGAGLGAAILSLIAQILAAGLYRGALRVADGKDFSLGQLFEGYNKTQVVFASIFIALATGIATILCYLPGVLIGFLTSYTLFFIVDQELEAAEAIQASVKFVWHHFGQTLLYFILAAVVLAIGALLFGVGLLVAGPVVLLGFAYTYRRLQGQPVMP
jgi:uncharacterized membrane protein